MKAHQTAHRRKIKKSRWIEARFAGEDTVVVSPVRYSRFPLGQFSGGAV
jgi:hypothetical protein